MDREIEREMDLGRGRSIVVGIGAPGLGLGHQGRGRGIGVWLGYQCQGCSTGVGWSAKVGVLVSGGEQRRGGAAGQGVPMGRSAGKIWQKRGGAHVRCGRVKLRPGKPFPIKC
jgi:hypothetical protein